MQEIPDDAAARVRKHWSGGLLGVQQSAVLRAGAADDGQRRVRGGGGAVPSAGRIRGFGGVHAVRRGAGCSATRQNRIGAGESAGNRAVQERRPVYLIWF